MVHSKRVMVLAAGRHAQGLRRFYFPWNLYFKKCNSPDFTSDSCRFPLTDPEGFRYRYDQIPVKELLMIYTKAVVVREPGLCGLNIPAGENHG
jgi:hypothetical protein